MKNIFVPAALALLFPALIHADDDLATAGQKIIETHAASLLQVEAVIDISVEGKLSAMAGGSQEQKSEALGVVIDKSGLILVSDGILNPAKMMKPMSVNVGGEQHTLSIKGQLKDIRIRLADGEEIPGRVVLTDDDLDLAFILPDKELTPEQSARLVPMTLGDGTTRPEILEQVLSLTRLSRDMNSEIAIHINRINAILKKPRTAYVSTSHPGAPVFNLSGHLLGFTLLNRNGTRSATEMRPGAMQLGTRAETILVPLSDILPSLDQALEEAAQKASKKE